MRDLRFGLSSVCRQILRALFLRFQRIPTQREPSKAPRRAIPFVRIIRHVPVARYKRAPNACLGLFEAIGHPLACLPKDLRGSGSSKNWEGAT
jgi:hypothetical protein